MTPSDWRRAVFVLLAAICVLQTSLLVTFTVLHVHKYHQLQNSYQQLTQRAGSILSTCGQPSEGVSKERVTRDTAQRLRQVRQATQAPATAAATPDPFIAHLTAEQEAILERHCGGDIKLCIPGPKGDPGLNGVAGQQGAQGQTGDQGPKGAVGPKGDSGPKGATGPQGLRGPKGETGPAGAVGDNGPAGPQGQKGTAGGTGAPGTDGAKGQTGPRGDTGNAGQAGAAGAAGQPGAKGEPGPQGPKGLKGPAGAKGASGAVPGRTCSCFARPRATGDTEITQESLPGSTVTLECPVVGTPPPEVTWTFRGGNLPSNAVRKGNDLVISNMQQRDVGQYQCHASNILGTTDIVVDLTMFNLNCDFENGYCAWSQSRTDQMNWSLNKGSTQTIFTGPDQDHTLNSALGQYAYLESNSGSPGNAADLTSPYLELVGPMCLEFWYYMYGADIDTISVYTKSTSGTETLAWSLSGDQGQGWKQASATVSPASGGGRTQIIIRATRKDGIEGDIAIDDISIAPGQCMKPPSSVACDFEVDMCGWQVENTVWRWTRHSGASGKPNTGPTGDVNNTASGQYAYLDGSSTQSPGALGRLTSPFVDSQDRQTCVTFYYHMFGNSVGSLTLKVKSADGSEYSIWQRSGDQGQDWHHGHVTIPVSSEPYRLVWEGVRGATGASDIAVDQINITTGGCSPAAELGPMGCDFELLTTCPPQWVQSSTDALNWQLQVASTGAQSGGPAEDHTLQTDRGIYASVTGTSGQEAALKSIDLARNTPHCLDLWYYIPNANAGELVVYREVLGNRLQTLNTIRYSGTQGGEWRHLAFTVNPFYTESNVVIVAKPQDTSAGPIVIDDLSMKSGFCT